MVSQISLYKLRPEVTPDKLEDMMRRTRSQLLRIPEVLSVKSGKKIDPFCEWPFFIALEFESLDKQAMCYDDPVWVKFIQEVIKPQTTDSLTLSYELEPGKNVKYS